MGHFGARHLVAIDLLLHVVLIVRLLAGTEKLAGVVHVDYWSPIHIV